jgi:dihydrofolate reductase
LPAGFVRYPSNFDMRKVILNLAVSLDGFIEGPDGEYDWCFMDQDYGMTNFFKRIDAVFLGRKSHELVEKTPGGYLAKMKRYVFSTTLKEIKDKNVILIKRDVATEVNKIKKEDGNDIWLFGGASLVKTFMNEGLVDELMLAVHPILLGKGKPLFQNIERKIQLKLFDSITYNTGLFQSFYYVLK